MITLPDTFVPRSAQPFMLDAGFVVRSARGLAIGRMETPGSRFGAEIQFPAMVYDTANELLSYLQAGKRVGLRLKWPLMATTQAGGTGAVNGSGVAGTTLPVRGLTASAVIKRGSWVTVVNTSGDRCLHSVVNPATVAGGGTVTLTVQPPLRTVLADGNTVLVSAPTIEGVITSEVNWDLPVNRIVPPMGFRIEEAEA